MPTAELPQELVGYAGLYNHGDPLLRRMRLEDAHDQPILDIAKHFEGVEVVILYAGSLYGSNNIQGLTKDLANIALGEKSCRVIYVSTDAEQKTAMAAYGQTPFLRMIFNDDSDFAPLSTTGEVEVTDVARGENFVQAGEVEVGAEKVEWGVEEYIRDYVRPFSRAAVTMTMLAYSTPNLAVYHIPTHTFLAHNVRPVAFNRDNFSKNLKSWKDGQASNSELTALLQAMRLPLILLVLVLIYHSLVFFGGEQYRFIPKVFSTLTEQYLKLS